MEQRTSSLPLVITDAIKSGTALVGDDFDTEQLETWFAQEKEAFFQSDAGNSAEDPWYAYMRYVNVRLGFDRLRKFKPSIRTALFLGPGRGDEIEEFRVAYPDAHLYLVEASDSFKSQLTARFPNSTVIHPHPSGEIELPDRSVDAVFAFSVLHHIPNVSAVIKDMARVLAIGGVLVAREPCSSMGDWRFPRSATPNERGISAFLMSRFSNTAGLQAYCVRVPILLEPINKMLKGMVGYRFPPFALLYAVDRMLSIAISWNDHYWRDSFFKKVGPSSYFYIFRK